MMAIPKAFLMIKKVNFVKALALAKPIKIYTCMHTSLLNQKGFKVFNCILITLYGRATGISFKSACSMLVKLLPLHECCVRRN